MAGSPLNAPGLAYVTGIPSIDSLEAVSELRWPQSVPVFDRMRNDGQIAAGLRAILAAMRRRRWRVGNEGCDPRVSAFVATELGLTAEAAARGRLPREGISWDPYLRTAVGAKLTFGHAVFEQQYLVGPPGSRLAAMGSPAVVAHLRRLSYRPPGSISGWDIDRDGGLRGVTQLVSVPHPGGWSAYEARPLSIDRLVVHVHEQEGAEWWGRSALRSLYRSYVVKDLLIRIGAAAVERNGMGVPVVGYDPQQGGTRAKALAIARAFRAGDESAVALPPGYTLTIVGHEGALKDELPLLRYHDQALGKGLGTMMMDLGHDAGARSLGDTFLELFAQAVNGLAGDFAEEVTEYVIRDLVRWTFGPGEPYPPLLFDEATPQGALTYAELAQLASAGVLVPDDNLEEELRRRGGWPLWPGAPVGDPLAWRDDQQQFPTTGPLAPGIVPVPALPPGDPASARALAEASARFRAMAARIAAREAVAALRPPPAPAPAPWAA